jgi:hypothetical protein
MMSPLPFRFPLVIPANAGDAFPRREALVIQRPSFASKCGQKAEALNSCFRRNDKKADFQPS